MQQVESAPTLVTRLLRCSSCRGILSREPDYFEVQELICTYCGSEMMLATFPPLDKRTIDNELAAPVLTGEEAGCFYHPEKQAARICDGCGRFLCTLCDVVWCGAHVCPECIHGQQHMSAGHVQPAHHRLPVSSLTCHDAIALSLAVYPMLLLWPTLVTGPLTMAYVLMFQRRPVSFLPVGRTRFTVAFMLGLLQTIGWLAFLIWMVWR